MNVKHKKTQWIQEKTEYSAFQIIGIKTKINKLENFSSETNGLAKSQAVPAIWINSSTLLRSNFKLHSLPVFQNNKAGKI